MNTCDYPYCHFEFAEWNPVQEKCLPYFTRDVNLVLGAETAAGKTAVAEAIMGYELLENPEAKAVYVSPLKAIGLEKHGRWLRHPTFGDMGVVLVDGDHAEGRKLLAESRIIVTTVESLDLSCRRKDGWLGNVRVLVFDEAHLLGDVSRGANAEGMLARFTSVNVDARLVCLSGTFPNLRQLASWVHLLNGKPTSFVKSSWRPLQQIKEVVVGDSLSEQIGHIVKDVIAHQDDGRMVFVHSRKTGGILCKALRKSKIKSAFYHAGLSAGRRRALLDAYRHGLIDVLVATSSLAMGITI